MDLWAEAGDLSREDPIETVFLGGGTPSLVSPGPLGQFLDFVRNDFRLAPGAEITVEMQPGTADADKLEAYARAGVNRFSVGAQTLTPSLLEQLQRRHTVEDSRRMVRDASRFGATSIDLIAALPGQTLEQWRRELDEVPDLGVTHVSVYELTFHPGTQFQQDLAAGNMRQSDEDLRLAIFEEGARFLCAAGFEHYEISNFAKPGCRSRHNENYWKLGNYVGLGAGAHSLLFPRRYLNPNDIDGYRDAIASGALFRKPADPADPDLFLLENLQMPLRLAEGVDVDWFQRKFDVDLRGKYGSRLSELAAEGLVEYGTERLRLTPAGRVRFDSILEYLL
jgi:oxygen-independent coproporphyrinogen-3 oxidase